MLIFSLCCDRFLSPSVLLDGYLTTDGRGDENYLPNSLTLQIPSLCPRDTYVTRFLAPAQVFPNSCSSCNLQIGRDPTVWNQGIEGGGEWNPLA